MRFVLLHGHQTTVHVGNHRASDITESDHCRVQCGVTAACLLAEASHVSIAQMAKVSEDGHSAVIHLLAVLDLCLSNDHNERVRLDFGRP